ncbi:hypothetical protein M413DRAFT_285230 [Hebeloma cylindrosporum]|uniref:Uncharacterized protein n=1 Tax=Hebeloma cylindrosporum TaxID=76867 RepID=A0A0C2XFZ0_HEBCY|nr:hypothetical protein M413DRAFT_285230 [Hebeloma cylindrosporum h7]
MVWCARPKVQPYTPKIFEFVLARSVPEDLSSSLQVGHRSRWLCKSTMPLTCERKFVQRLNGTGYDIGKLLRTAPCSVQDTCVYVDGSTIFCVARRRNKPCCIKMNKLTSFGTPKCACVSFTADVDWMLRVESSHFNEKGVDHCISGLTARFGADLSSCSAVRSIV